MQQQFAGPGWIRSDVGRRAQQGGYVKAEQPGLTVLDDDIALRQLCVALAQALYFPTLQGQPGLEAVFYEVVMPGLFIQRNGAGTAF